MPDSRESLIRAIGIGLWAARAMNTGDWQFNTHHQHYQFCLPPHGKLLVLVPQLVEARPAQMARWLDQLARARAMVDEALATSEARV